MSERIWTDEELADLSKRFIEKAHDAIDRGDTEKAHEYVDKMYEQLAHLHDGSMTWIAGLQSWIYERHGVDGVRDAERFAHGIEFKLLSFLPEETDYKSFVEHMAVGLGGHVYQHMTIEEDDEKVVITNTPCGSGGRLIQKGGYECGLAKITEPADITFNKTDYPIYCVHCALFNMNALDETGDFLFLHNPPQPDGAYCQVIFYKDKSKIPTSYYERLNRKNPHLAEAE